MLPIYFSEPPEKRGTLLSYTGHGAGVLQEGEGDVTSDFALMVEAALGISAELLVNRQARYNMAVSLKEKYAICVLPYYSMKVLLLSIRQ